jgi:hypothetical protein
LKPDLWVPDIKVGAIMVGCVVSDLVLTSVDDRPSDRSCISSRVGILLRSSARFAICAREYTSLMTKKQDLDLLLPLGPKAEHDQLEHSPQRPVQK